MRLQLSLCDLCRQFIQMLDSYYKKFINNVIKCGAHTYVRSGECGIALRFYWQMYHSMSWTFDQIRHSQLLGTVIGICIDLTNIHKLTGT